VECVDLSEVRIIRDFQMSDHLLNDFRPITKVG